MVETPKPKGNGKGIDAGLWRQVRIRALQEDKAAADVMNDALRAYFADADKPATPPPSPAPEPQAPQDAPRTAPSGPKATTPA